MKLKYIFLLVSIFFVGCSKNEEPNAVDNPIKLSSNSVRILAGNDCLIDVYSDTENLGLIEQNPEIATGWWTNNGRSIRIKGESVGVTSIYLPKEFFATTLHPSPFLTCIESHCLKGEGRGEG